MFPETAHGTYILILELKAPVALTVGRLGTFAFAAGWYAYVGSAFGTGGLGGRLKHHLGPKKRLHWHVDYLSQTASVREIWYLASEMAYEHRWAALLTALPHAQVPVPRFGASDCKCVSHLFYFPTPPSFDHFQTLTVEHGAVRCWQAASVTE